jgi:hypothetical protein
VNKSQGATTAAAVILAAGAFLRPSVQANLPQSPTTANVAQPSALANIAGSGSGVEGPWKASCQYWAPARAGERAPETTPSNFSLTVAGTEQRLDSHLQVSAAPNRSSCSGNVDQWGIPSVLPGSNGKAPEITAIIAIVPDPERGHIELDFDRTIDALMQAASDNGYVGSYFWLPWRVKNEREFRSTSASTGGSDEDRLKQPGLIVLKPGGANEKDPGLSYRRVIYVFLVAATPTQGVDGEELRRAFDYEAYLLGKPNTSLSMRSRSGQTQHTAGATRENSIQQQKHHSRQQEKSSLEQKKSDRQQKDPGQQQNETGQEPTNEMDLILFNYSGSAASLREGVDVALTDAGGRHPLLSTSKIKTVSIAGATSTELVGTLLNGKFGKTDIRFHSFEENTSVEEAEVTNLFQDEWGSCDRIAFLAEDGTVFGSSVSNAYAGNPQYEGAAKPGENEASAKRKILSPCQEDKPLVLNFPRDISLLRNATAKEGEKSKEQLDSSVAPYLRFSLRDSNAEDSVPHFSTDSTPLSQEAQLMAIGRRLVHSRIRTIAISASSILDELFIAQFLHRACPDARLVFLGGGDLLIEREIDNLQYVGAITFSPYSLVNLDHDFSTPRHMRAFADSQSEAFYNAASFTFWDRDNPIPWLAGYPFYAPQNVLRPLLWATAVGRDGYYPLGILNQCVSYAEPRFRQQRHLFRDRIAQIAALRDIARVSKALHQHNPGIVRCGRGPSPSRWAFLKSRGQAAMESRHRMSLRHFHRAQLDRSTDR